MSEKPQRIEDAIADYADRCGDAGREMVAAMGTYEYDKEPEPYSSGFLAVIYAPRVRKLFELLEEEVGDIIVNLLHLVTMHGGDPQAVHDRCWLHFQSEVGLGYGTPTRTI